MSRIQIEDVDEEWETDSEADALEFDLDTGSDGSEGKLYANMRLCNAAIMS